MAKYQSFFNITLFIACTAVASIANAGREGPGGTGGGDLTSSDLLDFSEDAGFLAISPESVRGYHEAAEPALKRLEFFIPDFAQDLQKAMRSKKWLIDPKGVSKPKGDQSSLSDVLLVGRMAYQDEHEIRLNGKLLKSKQIPDAIWGKLIVHEAVRAFSMNLPAPWTEEKLREVVRLIYAPEINDNVLYDEISSRGNDKYTYFYITRSNQLASLEKEREDEKLFCSKRDSLRKTIPLSQNDSEFFDSQDRRLCSRIHQRIERLSYLQEDEMIIARLNRVIQKIIAQKIKEPEKK